jgi:hypothetical protein
VSQVFLFSCGICFVALGVCCLFAFLWFVEVSGYNVIVWFVFNLLAKNRSSMLAFRRCFEVQLPFVFV